MKAIRSTARHHHVNLNFYEATTMPSVTLI